MTSINFTAPPTCARFMQSDAFFRLIAGPVGSGKTTACIFELLRRALEQEECSDGLRHTRFAIVRQTLKQLKDTVLKDITQWLNGIVHYKVSENTIYVSVGNVRSEWLLIPLEDAEDQKRLLSSQLTGAWMSEAIEMDVNIVPAIMGRLGRFPSRAQMKEGRDPALPWPTWFGAIADTNFPTEGSDWHRVMEVQTPPHWQIFKQPGGMEPDAENIENLPGGRRYYERLADGQNEDWVKRYVHAQYGNDPSGTAVFRSTFKKGFHTSKEKLIPSPGYPLIIAQDFGRNPASLVGQLDYRGRLLVFKELTPIDVGLELHVRTNLRPLMTMSDFMGMPHFVVGDPAGTSKNTHFEETSFDLLKRMGFQAHPAPTNDIDPRIRSVEQFFLMSVNAGPGILIDEEGCPNLVRALSGMYRFAKRRNGEINPIPEKKHPWSDVADCLQYMCMASMGGFTNYVMNRGLVKRPARPPMPTGAWT